MADWVWVESPGTSLTEQPRVRSAAFGDGYEQRAPDGLNPLRQVWDYQAVDVDDAIAAEMVDFLRSHGGTEPFNYVPLWATTALKFTCDSWRRSLGSQPGLSSISASFKQWFGP